MHGVRDLGDWRLAGFIAGSFRPPKASEDGLQGPPAHYSSRGSNHNNAGKVAFCLLSRQAPCGRTIMRHISSMLAFLHIFGVVVAASRPSIAVLPQSLAETPIGRGVASSSIPAGSFDQGRAGEEGRGRHRVTAIDTLGSRPPTCRNKCHSCFPCEAIQVPTSLKNNVQYSNYEPEGWKCRCRNKIFNP